jgi:hypothetical protein
VVVLTAAAAAEKELKEECVFLGCDPTRMLLVGVFVTD